VSRPSNLTLQNHAKVLLSPRGYLHGQNLIAATCTASFIATVLAYFEQGLSMSWWVQTESAQISTK